MRKRKVRKIYKSKNHVIRRLIDLDNIINCYRKTKIDIAGSSLFMKLLCGMKLNYNQFYQKKLSIILFY